MLPSPLTRHAAAGSMILSAVRWLQRVFQGLDRFSFGREVVRHWIHQAALAIAAASAPSAEIALRTPDDDFVFFELFLDFFVILSLLLGGGALFGAGYLLARRQCAPALARQRGAPMKQDGRSPCFPRAVSPGASVKNPIQPRAKRQLRRSLSDPPSPPPRAPFLTDDFPVRVLAAPSAHGGSRLPLER